MLWTSEQAQAVDQAARWIADADGLVIAAGAGMGVDSGLPDFRGDQGLWRAYPALGRAGLSFESIANPAAFDADPRLAWGFYGHRLALYRRTVPHAGFAMLEAWAARTAHGASVFTSNVDGQFQAAGFGDAVVHECHGSIHFLQCTRGCGAPIWPADGFEPEVDEAACLLRGEPPACPGCGALARPNVLMFGDAQWRDDRAQDQAQRQRDWLARVRRPVIIEIGAGTRVPSVRWFTRSLVQRYGPRLVRINVREPEVPHGQGIGLALSAASALSAIDQRLDASGSGAHPPRAA